MFFCIMCTQACARVMTREDYQGALMAEMVFSPYAAPYLQVWT